MPTSACKLAYNALRVQPILACFLESGAKVLLFSEYAKDFGKKLLVILHFVVLDKKIGLCGDGLAHALAGIGCEVGGQGVGRDDAEIALTAQRGTLGPYEAVVEGAEAGGAGYLLEGELYGESHIAVGDAHVGYVVA